MGRHSQEQRAGKGGWPWSRSIHVCATAGRVALIANKHLLCAGHCDKDVARVSLDSSAAVGGGA